MVFPAGARRLIATGGIEAKVLQAQRRRWSRNVIIAGAVAAVGLGLLAGALAAADQLAALSGLGVLLIPAIVWRRPAIGIFGLGCAGLIVEQYRIGAGTSDMTDRIPLYTSLSDSLHLSGVYFNLAEVGIALMVVVLVMRAGITRDFTWPSGYVGGSYLAMIGFVGIAALHGIAGGGNTTMILWEVRPFFYVFILYLFALQLKPRLGTLEAFYWFLVIGTGIKAIQGVLVLLPIVTSAQQRPEFLLSHDDSFFFGVDIVLVAALWLFRQKGRLRTVSTILVPIVFVINMANTRRTAWLILAAGLAVLLMVFVVRVPERRVMVARLVAIGGVIFAFYLVVFWNQNGILAQPARAVHSTVAPSVRDELSDAYRVVENANLALAIQGTTPLGAGFGIPIKYVIPITDLSKTDPFIDYITHDGIMYVWWRTGMAGFIAWWTWILMVLISAVSLARARDVRLACFGAVAATAVVGYVIQGYYDFGLFFFRMAFFMGLLIGLIQVAHRIEAHRVASRPAALEEAA